MSAHKRLKRKNNDGDDAAEDAEQSVAEAAQLMSLLHRYARENLLLANIYIKDPAVEVIKKDQKIPVIWFVANVGGILGLCMGCSLVTIFEVLHHVTLILLRTTTKGVSKISNVVARNPFQITTAIAQGAAGLNFSDDNLEPPSKEFDSVQNLENTTLQSISVQNDSNAVKSQNPGCREIQGTTILNTARNVSVKRKNDADNIDSKCCQQNEYGAEYEVSEGDNVLGNSGPSKKGEADSLSYNALTEISSPVAESQSQKEIQLTNIFTSSPEAIADDNCLVRRVKCGHKGPIGHDRNPCNDQVRSLYFPPPYHHNHHNGKRQNQKLRPLKVTTYNRSINRRMKPSFVSIHSNIKRANSHDISTRPIEPTCSVELSTKTLSSTINSCSSDNEMKLGWLVNGKTRNMDHNIRENDIRQVQNYL